MDLRLTAAQVRLREEARAFCAGLRPLLEADDEWRRQGMLSDGDSREVTRALGEAGWIGMSWPRRARRSRSDPARRDARGGGARLPLAAALPYLLSYKTIGAALERFAARPRRAAPAADRPRRARLLPGVLGAGRRQRPRLVDDPRRAARRHVRRRRAQDLDVERAARGLDLPGGAHRSRTRRGTAASPCSSRRWTRPGSRCARSRRSAVAGCARCSSTGSRSRRGTSSASSTAAGTVLMSTLDFERITAEKLGGVAWVLDGARERHGSGDGTPGAYARSAASCRRAAAVVPRCRRDRPRAAGVASLGDGEARRRARRAAGRAMRRSTCSASTGSPRAPGRLSRAVPRRSTAPRSGSTIAGGTAEVQQLVIARRGLGLVSRPLERRPRRRGGAVRGRAALRARCSPIWAPT